MPRQTHTLATLELSRAAYDEVAGKLQAAGYQHAFDGELIDMTGIGLLPGPAAPMVEISDDGLVRRGTPEMPGGPPRIWTTAMLLPCGEKPVA